MKNKILGIILLLASCSGNEQKPVTENDLVGNWLITDADPQYKNSEERQYYLMAKDSIRALKGLKLVSIKNNAVFQQSDSMNTFPGSWLLHAKQQQLFINNGGIGFSNFTGTVRIDKDSLLLNEKMELGPVSIAVLWHFIKVPPDSPANYLFVPANNSWRIKPGHTEEEDRMRKRLSAMFHYYSVYFTLVSKEADYFSPRRVLLPVRYYQHGVGMRDMDAVDNFKALFFDEADFKKAYEMVGNAIKSDQHYPRGKDFTEEYAAYFAQLETAVLKK